jgi:hypothetical protein
VFRGGHVRAIAQVFGFALVLGWMRWVSGLDAADDGAARAYQSPWYDRDRNGGQPLEHVQTFSNG